MPIFTKIKNPKIPQPNPTASSPLGGAFVSTQEKKKKKDTPTPAHHPDGPETTQPTAKPPTTPPPPRDPHPPGAIPPSAAPAPPLKWDQGLSPSYPLNPPLWAHWPQSRSKVNASWRKCFLSISALWPDFAFCRFFFFSFFLVWAQRAPSGENDVSNWF